MLSDRISGLSQNQLGIMILTGVTMALLLLLAPTANASNSNNESVPPVTARFRKDSEARGLMSSAEGLRATWSTTELREAKGKYRKAALLWTSISDYSNASLATLKAGDVCFLLSELREALKLYRQAALLGGKSRYRVAEGKALSQIGLVYSYMGDNDVAKKYLTKALALLKIAENDPDATAKNNYGEALSNMAELSYSEGNFPGALDQFKEADKFFVDNPGGKAKVHLFVGRIFGSLGDADKAQSEISEALKLYQAVKNRDGEALALSALGQFQSFKGDQEQAIQLHNDARKIFVAVGDRLGEAIALNGLGQANAKLNKPSFALRNYEEALSLVEDVGALDFVAVFTFKLAQFHLQVGNHERALTYYQRCLKLSHAARKVRNEANALSEIAIVYASQRRPDEAARQHRKVQEFYKTIGDRRGQATSLNKYGDFLLEIGQRQQALNKYLEALALSEAVDDKSIVLTSLYNLARTHRALGNLEAALPFIEQALDISERLRANVGSPDARAAYFSGVRKYYDACRDILMQLNQLRAGEGFDTRAFFISERSRARLLLDLAKEWQIDLREGATAELLRNERHVNAMIQSLTRYQYELSLSKRRDSTDTAEVDQRMDQLRAEQDEIQAKLRAQTPKQTSVVRLELNDLEQFQKELQGANAMLLEYSVGDERSYLWAITAGSVHSYELPPRKDLEVAVREVYDLMTIRQRLDAGVYGDYRAIIEAADACYPEKAAQLSRMLLGPVAGLLGTKRLIVVTEGALQYIPFGALPLPESGPTQSETPSYLIQTNEIVVLPSMSKLLTLRAARHRAASPGKVVAVIADPVFRPQDERVKSRQLSETTVHAASSLVDQALPQALRDGGPSRLIYAAEEADAIVEAAPWGTTMVAKGFDASREIAMSPRVGEYQIVHFATHGFLDSEHPQLSAIVLSMVDQNGVEKNGFMPLHDIYSLDLSAELTVLSACQTALGKDIKGEGMVGLTHSFMSAGSRSVVSSLWKVDDRATEILMSDFYQSMLRNGLPPITALRAAKLKMIQDKRWNQPYYWAGFVFQGDYESRITVESNSRFLIVLSLLLLVLTSSGLIIFLRSKRRPSPAAKLT